MKYRKRKKLKTKNKASVTCWKASITYKPLGSHSERRGKGQEKNVNFSKSIESYKSTDPRRARKSKQDKHKENHTKEYHDQMAENK